MSVVLPQAGGPRAPTPTAGAGNVKAVRAQLELADQDCTRISAPDYSTPFQSLEDAVDRLLPFHVFGAEDPQQTDIREVASQQGLGAALATSRAEAWADFITHKVDDYGAGLAMLEKLIHKAEAESLQRNKLPLLMLHSYAAAEAKQLVDTEQQRPTIIAAEREAARQVELRRQEEQRQAALLAQQRAQQEAILRQQQQQQMVAAQQAILQQQQQAASAAAAQQHSQQQGPQQAFMQRHHGVSVQPLPAGIPPSQQAVRSQGTMLLPGAGPPAAAAAAQRASGKPVSAADAKAKQLAALAARINQRK